MPNLHRSRLQIDTNVASAEKEELQTWFTADKSLPSSLSATNKSYHFQQLIAVVINGTGNVSRLFTTHSSSTHVTRMQCVFCYNARTALRTRTSRMLPNENLESLW
jgi:hypothetical protein